MKITVYTIKDCAFSKQEKEYLNTNKLAFEEKDLETNKEFLTEMLAISNNFAGTPITRVEKDDGSIAVLKGFTKEEFDTTFGLVAASTTSDTGVQSSAAVNDTLIKPKTDLTDSTVSTDSADSTDPKLNSVLDKLEEKTSPTEVIIPPAETTPPPPPTTDLTDSTDSTIPPADSPTIPDFPSK
ncbi:MAG: glutaredoxin family protein [Patescibacteria group bacterium]